MPSGPGSIPFDHEVVCAVMCDGSVVEAFAEGAVSAHMGTIRLAARRWKAACASGGPTCCSSTHPVRQH